jgi:hypothetical protein
VVPLHLLITFFVDSLQHEQHHIIQYLREENRILKSRLRTQRVRFTDVERRLGCVRRGCGQAAAGPGRDDRHARHHPPLAPAARRPGVDVLEAPAWMAQRALGDSLTGRADGDRESDMGLHPHSRRLEESGPSRGAVDPIATMLKQQGIPPSGARQTSWQTFLRAHWDALVAADFFTTDVWTLRGLVTYYTLFVIKLHSRRVHLVGSTPTPDDTFMLQRPTMWSLPIRPDVDGSHRRAAIARQGGLARQAVARLKKRRRLMPHAMEVAASDW